MEAGLVTTAGRKTSAIRLPSLVQMRSAGLMLAALTLPVGLLLGERGLALAGALAASLVIAAFWTTLFAFVRGRPLDGHFLVAALLFALFLPSEIPGWQLALSLSFGLVVGEQIFGGRGFSFLNPAVVALAFQFFSFPASFAAGGAETQAALAAVPGALLLFAAGLVSWRVLAGFAIGFALWTLLRQIGWPDPSVATASLALGLVFFVADPAPGPATHPGRYAHGFLAGMLVVVLGAAGEGVGAARTIVFAALLASIFTPLADRIVILVNANRRRRRHD